MKLKDDPLLPSILILVSAKNNKSLSNVNNINNTVVRMLIDTASSRNFITESLAKKLCLKSMGISPVELQTLNGFIAGVKSVYEVQATSLINDFTYRFLALSVNEICTVSECKIKPEQMPKNLIGKIADFVPRPPENVDVLLGMPDAVRIFNGFTKQRVGKYNLFLTLFGSGFVDNPNRCFDSQNVHSFLTNDVDEPLNDDVIRREQEEESLREIEAALKSYFAATDNGKIDEASNLSEEQILCKTHFYDNVFFDEEKCKYVNEIFFRPTVHELSSNYRACMSRLIRLENSLIKRTNETGIDFCAAYEKEIEKLIEKGFARVVLGPVERERYYLPHRDVTKTKNSVISKMRVVFDCSAGDQNKLSLNGCIADAPNNLPSIADVVVQFRSEDFAFTADVVEFYHQVLLGENSIGALRFLWRSFQHAQPKMYELLTNTFGEKASSYRSVETVNFHAMKYDEEFPLEVAILRNRRYSDDLSYTDADEDKLISTFMNLKLILQQGGFRLSKVATNSRKLKELLDPADLVVGKEFASGAHDDASALGIGWSPSSDELFYRGIDGIIEFANSLPVTKRTVLAVTPRVFDSLGLIHPYIVQSKMLLKAAWQLSCAWDDPLPNELQRAWTNWLEQLPALKNIRIPRNIVMSNAEKMTIEAYGDASEKAIGIAVYVRCQKGAHVTSNLIGAASRVKSQSPTSTIARLELIAMFEAASLAATRAETLGIPRKYIYLYTDSRIAYHWVRAKTADCWQVFVANRVRKIVALVNRENVRWISTHENPSDMPSRFERVENFANDSLWWHGPNWLLDPNEKFREDLSLELTSKERDEILQNERKEKVISFATALADHAQCSTILDITRYSTLKRLLGVTAAVFKAVKLLAKRFKMNFSSSADVPDSCVVLASSNEKRLACIYWARAAQIAEWPTEFAILSGGGEVSKKSNIFSLQPQIDPDIRLLTLTSRIESASGNRFFRRPIILPKNAWFTRLVLEDYHVQSMHLGHETTLRAAREVFWIVGGKAVARSVCSNCLKCKRLSAAPKPQQMAPLPSVRVLPHSVYSMVMADYAGPIYVRRGHDSEPTKGYILLITCLSTRALYLAYVPSLTASDFICAFELFCAKHGAPKYVQSDNGSNLSGGKKFVDAIWKVWGEKGRHEIAGKFEAQGTTWKLTCPKSPHRSGAIERMVKLIKPALIKTLGNAFVHEDDFRVILARTERAINSRPYCSLSSSVHDRTPLSPLNFITGDVHSELPSPLVHQADVTISKKEDVIARWNRRQQILDDFWERWRSEYVSALVSRDKWYRQSRPLKVGELVLLHVDGKRQQNYPLAKVVEAIPSKKDNLVRTYIVETAGGKRYRRDTNCLARLEIDQAFEFDDVDDTPRSVARPMLKEVPKNEKMTEKDVLKDEKMIENELKDPVRTRSGRVSKKPNRY